MTTDREPPVPQATWSLEGRVAIVTGGGSGMGQAIARTLASAGAVVVPADIAPEAAAKTVALIAAAGGVAEAAELNVTSKAGFDALVDKVVRTYERLDVLCNIAGVTSLKSDVVDTDEEGLDATFAVHFKGVLYGSQAAVRVMKPSGGGSIVNMSSTTIDITRRRTLDYTVGKGAVAALTRVLAEEVGRHNIRVNAIAPGFVATPGFTYYLEDGPKREAHFQSWFDMSPMGRISSVEEIGQQVLYLASDASSFVTGQILRANGGVTMPW